MIHVEVPEKLSKPDRYRFIASRLQGIIASETDTFANLCNVAAFLYWTLGDVNWAGFYMFKGKDLVLGPFGGKPACSRIAIGKGVCGTAAKSRELQLVPDVEQFPGHIACDGASRSEIVVPIFSQNVLWGVLDVDSPTVNRFDADDAAGMQLIVKTIQPMIDQLMKSVLRAFKNYIDRQQK